LLEFVVHLLILLGLAAQDSTAYVQADGALDEFWKGAVALGDRAQQYSAYLMDGIASDVPTVAGTVHHIRTTMSQIIVATGDMKGEMYSAADVHGEGLDDILSSIEKVLADLFEKLKEEFPAPDHAPSHEMRLGNVSMILERAEDAIVRVGVDHGMSETKLRAHLDKLRPLIVDVVVTIGDLAEQHPVLLGALLVSATLMIIPESWLLRPLLRLFGFGPYGPVKGSTAAWAQRVFYGAAVTKGSWFSHLQKAAMTFITEPVKKTILGAIFGAIGLAGGIFGGCGRG